MRRYGHTITTSIANEVERAFQDGWRASERHHGTNPVSADLREMSKQAVQRGDEMHNLLAIPMTGTPDA